MTKHKHAIYPARYSHILLVLFLLAFPVIPALAEKSFFDLHSPDGHINVTINLTDHIDYAVRYDDTVLMDSCSMALALKDETLGSNPELVAHRVYTINEAIKRPVPLRNALVNNNCNVLVLRFQKHYSVEFRAYNDGVAYRFVTRQGERKIDVTDEVVDLHTPDTCDMVVTPTASFRTAYEISYVRTTSGKNADLHKSTLPVLIDTRKGYKILVSEADLFDYPCLFLKGEKGNRSKGVFPKCPLEFGPDGDRSLKIVKRANYIARTDGNRSFPWRVFMISHNDRQIFENEMVFKLSRTNQLGKTDWIKPGQVTWEWWHDARLYGVDFKSGYNTNSYKYYIDFASKFGIPYIIMDEGWAKSTLDPYTPNPNIDLFRLIHYGQTKHVKIILWLTWLTVQNHPELFKTFSKWGIAGVKIDFMDRSDQWMVNFYERVAREAAQYHLFVDYHGAFKPAGMERAFPNILAYEGVVGMEQNISGGRATPDNNAYLPFIRNVVGPMDFTPGAMISVHPEDYCSTRTNPESMGTRAYQLALYVVFESGLQMLADNPFYYYREKECTDFITHVPVLWDETRVLAARVGSYFVVAKRRGDKWFIGAITNSTVRDLTLHLNFLNRGRSYQMTAFEDGINADVQAMDYRKINKTVQQGDSLQIHMVRDGGWTAVFQ